MFTIQFSHANGFPAAAYQELFDYFPTHAYHFSYINKIGHNPRYPPDWGWKNLRNELIHYIEANHTQPVIGIGHSMGGVITLLAAQKSPHLFSQIILLDPPIFGRQKQWFMRLFYLLGLSGKFAPANKAKKRRTHFSNPNQAHQYFAGKPLFKQFTNQALANYVTHGLLPHPPSNGFQLAFNAQTEYRLFCTTPANYSKKPLTLPASLVYANQYEVLNKADLAWIERFFPTIELIPFSGSHLFPFEQPKQTAQLIRQLIQKESTPALQYDTFYF